MKRKVEVECDDSHDSKRAMVTSTCDRKRRAELDIDTCSKRPMMTSTCDRKRRAEDQDCSEGGKRVCHEPVKYQHQRWLAYLQEVWNTYVDPNSETLELGSQDGAQKRDFYLY